MNKKCAENQIVYDEYDKKVRYDLIIVWASYNSHYIGTAFFDLSLSIIRLM